MKRLMVVALMGLALAMVGCASVGSSPGGGVPDAQHVAALSPVQVATIACPQLNMVHVQLVAFNAALSADPATAKLGQQATVQLAAIHPMVQKVCDGPVALAGVDASNLQTLVQTGLPALSTLASTLPLPPLKQAQLQGALVIAETAAGVVSVVGQQLQQAAPWAVAPSTPAQ